MHIFIYFFNIGRTYKYEDHGYYFYGLLCLGLIEKDYIQTQFISKVILLIKISISMQFISYQLPVSSFLLLLWGNEEAEMQLLSDFAKVAMAANNIHVFLLIVHNKADIM